MIQEHHVLSALRELMDPKTNLDLVSSQSIKNIKIDKGNVSLDVEVDQLTPERKTELTALVEQRLKRLEGIREILVYVRPRKLSLKQATAASLPVTALAQVKSIIAISSCKGGVGKSTVAACLAKGLIYKGYRVGLLDADIYGPSVPTLFNLQRPSVQATADNRIQPIEVAGLKMMSFGFLLGDGPAVLRGPLVSRYIQQLLHQTDWGELDFLLIDMPPGTGDIQLTITQTVGLNGAVIVTTPQTLSLVDVTRGIYMFEEVKVPIVGVIENMAYFECPDCHKQHSIWGKAGGSQLTDRFGLKTLVQLPILPELAGQSLADGRHTWIQDMVANFLKALENLNKNESRLPQVSFDERAITLRWPDGRRRVIENRELRLSCRCAVCINELTGEKLINDADIPADIKPVSILSLGNYALGIRWSDGHSSGIYPYASIEALPQHH